MIMVTMKQWNDLRDQAVALAIAGAEVVTNPGDEELLQNLAREIDSFRTNYPN